MTTRFAPRYGSVAVAFGTPPSKVVNPVRLPADGGRRRALAVVLIATGVAAIGLFGPRSAPTTTPSPAPADAVASGPPAIAGLGWSTRPAGRHRAPVDAVARQAGAAVIIEGRVGPGAGRLVVDLEFGATILAMEALAPQNGRFQVTLRPRVPFGGLIARLVVRHSGTAPGAPLLDRSIVLEPTTVGRRTVDPATGSTVMPASLSG